ncbi:cobalamin biosynthesis protein [Rhizobium sp. LjRoot254]|uniref:cobalamin biosynthesis protein n=1 Tax=Rhizobium sp. LjRoot254 TaxID=3342297 RepID=UPI003ECD0EE5
MKRELVIGLGVSQTASGREAADAAMQALSAAGLQDEAVLAIATIFGRAEHPAVQAVASYFGVSVIVFDATRLEQETPRLANPSDGLFERIGCHGVAEAAALAATGPAGALVIEKTKSGGVTIAVAEAARST